MPDLMDPMHLARLAALEGALLALLRECEGADEVTATLDNDGLNIAYLYDGNEVAGEGV